MLAFGASAEVCLCSLSTSIVIITNDVVTVCCQLELLGSAQCSSTDRLSRKVTSPLKGLGRMPLKSLRRDSSTSDSPPQQSPPGERSGKPVRIGYVLYGQKGVGGDAPNSLPAGILLCFLCRRCTQPKGTIKITSVSL